MRQLLLLCCLLLPAWGWTATLTVYSAGPQSLIDVLAKDFQEETGHRVNVFQSSTGQVMARLQSEQRNPLADVVITASWGSAQSLKEAGLLAPYTAPDPEQIPDFLQDSHYVAQGVAALAMVWNSQSGTPKPADWSDLTDDAYRDKVTMPDPSQSGTAFELLIGLITSMGEDDAWGLFGDLAEQGLLVPGPNARALNPVLQGAKAVVFGAVDYIALTQQNQGESIEVIFPKSGTIVAPRPVMVMKSSQQQELAAQFVDYMLSPEGQKRVAEHFLIPAREGIESRRPGLESLPQLSVDEDLNERRGELLQQFRQVVRP